jgi:hypothetical protein
LLRLEELVEELQRIAKKSQPFKPDLLLDASRFLALPRYLTAGPAAPQLLARDLKTVVREEFSGNERRLLEVLLCLPNAGFPDSAVPVLDIRYNMLAREIGMNADHLRKNFRKQAYTELAFRLFCLASSVGDPREAPGFGYRYVRHDWSVKLDPVDPMVERFSFATTIETTFERRRLFAFGTDLFGSKMVAMPTVKSVAEGHRYVGYVPINASHPMGEIYHVVYFGRALALGERTTVVVEYAARRPPESSGSGLVCGVVTPVDHVRLTVYAPLPLLRTYRRIERLHGGPYSDPVKLENVARNEDAPASYEISQPEVGHEFEIAWPDPEA